MSDSARRVAEVRTFVHVVYTDGGVEEHGDTVRMNGDADVNRSHAEKLGQGVYAAVQNAIDSCTAD